MILLLLLNLHEIQMAVMWQIECFVPIYNAAHNARIVDNLGKFILNCSLSCNLYIKMLEFRLTTNVF